MPTERLPWFFWEDPADAAEIFRYRVHDATQRYAAGEISADNYRAHLKSFGYAPGEIESEVNLHSGERRR